MSTCTYIHVCYTCITLYLLSCAYLCSNSIIQSFEYSFSTSRQTLTWIPDTFFTSLLSGRINTLLDDNGSIFIDRDPTLFTYVLNYLRTKEINLPETESGIKGLMHEAEYYGIIPLIQQLSICQDLDCSSCGNVLFYGCLNPPSNCIAYHFS